MKYLVSLCFILLINSITYASINKSSAFVSYYLQRTEINIKDTTPKVTTTCEIIFKFNDEKSISLYHDYSVYISSFEKLDDIEVFTKNPQPNGKMKTIEIKDFKMNNAKSNSVFYDDEKEINITFLGLTVGSEAHVKYTTSTQEAHFTDPFSFSFYMPVQERRYELIVPEEVTISLIEKNILPTTFKFEKEVKRNETIYTWTAKDIEEQKPIDNPPARMAYTPHVLYKIDEYKARGKVFTVSKTPRDLFNWYVKNIKHVNKKPSDRIQALADSIVKGCTNDRDKVIRIYDWVKQNIRYVAFENGMEGIIPREADLVCTRRYGDCKDMSSLQFALLRAVKVPAYLTWLGTRRIPYTYSEVPLKNTDNHMIASVNLDGKWHFLDATDPNGFYDLPSDHIQGKQVMIYKNDTEYELVMVPVVKAEKNMFQEVNKIRLDKTKATITTETKYTGLLANNISNQLLYVSENDRQEFGKGIIKSISNNAALEKFVVEKATPNREVNYRVDFSIADFAKEVDDEIYVNVLMDRTLSNSYIKEPNRTIPYSFQYNSMHEITYQLSVPENYKVAYLPENVDLKQDGFGASINYSQSGQDIICKQRIYLDLTELELKPAQFESWNKFIKQLNKAYKESITFKKL